MKISQLLLSSTLGFIFCTGTALADPKDGFGLNAGLSSYSRDCGGGGCATDTSGLSIGVDYQVALSNVFSINPFLMTSSESASNASASDISIGHGLLGIQLRYWAGDLFFGGHLASYSEVFTLDGFSVSGTGGGAGLVAGWEKPDGGLYAMGQLDSATVKYSTNATVPLSAFRLSIGYRWK
jgi:hypothetical protein